jgi:hypothetical protein
MQKIQEAQATYYLAPSVEDVLRQALRLPTLQKIRLVEKLMRELEIEMSGVGDKSSEGMPRRSLYGLLAHLGSAPSAEEIDEARREIWANFPRKELP